MKRISYSIYVFIFLFFLSNESIAQWQPSIGLEGGQVRNIIQFDSLLFTTCNNYIYKSNDDFISSWTNCPDSTTGWDLYKVDSCIFTYGNTNFKRSFDYGETWQEIQSEACPWTMCNIGNTIFVDNANCLYKSDNYFDSIKFEIAFPNVYELLLYSTDSMIIAMDPSLYAIYQSNDTANSWDTLTLSGLPISNKNTFSIKYFNNTIWIAGSYGIYFLNEARTKWIEANAGFPNDKFVLDVEELSNELYCCIMNSGLFKYDNNDSIWMSIDNSPLNISSIIEVNNELICSTENGPAKMDSTGNWTTNYNGLNHRDVYSLAYINDSVYVYAGNELFKSVDGGCSFSKINNLKGQQVIATDSALYSLSETDLLISRNFGNSWDTINTNISPSLYSLTMNNAYYYIGTSSGLYRTRIDTISWTLLDNGLSTWALNRGVEAIDSVIVVNDYFSNLVCISRNYGDTFDTLYTTNGVILSVTKKGNRFYILDDSKILFSDDLGYTWDEIDYNDAYYLDHNDLCLVVSGGSVHAHIDISYDNGTSWLDIKDNLPSSTYGSFENITFYNQRLFSSSTRNSLWYRDDILTSIFINSDDSIQLPTIIYPNPTTDKINIELPLDIKEANYNIYNLRGKLFKSGTISAIENIIDLRNLKTGLYIIEIYTKEKRISEEIIKFD